MRNNAELGQGILLLSGKLAFKGSSY